MKKKKYKFVFTDSFNKSLEKIISNNPIYLIPRTLDNIKYETKWFFQRIFKGYDDMEIIDFYSCCNNYIRKRFKSFAKAVRKNREGCPTCFYCYDDNMKATYTDEEAMKKWIEVLDKIELAFDLMYLEETASDEWFKKTSKEMIKDSEKIDEGLKLFGEYYRNLWL